MANNIRLKPGASYFQAIPESLTGAKTIEVGEEKTFYEVFVDGKRGFVSKNFVEISNDPESKSDDGMSLKE